MIWHQKSVCNIFFHLDRQVIIINKPFPHFFIVNVSAWISKFFLKWAYALLFFCIYFLKHLGTYSSWRLTLLGTFIFSEFFHLWVQAFYCMLLAIFFRTTGFQLNTINWIPRHISLETTKKFKVSVVFELNFGQN